MGKAFAVGLVMAWFTVCIPEFVSGEDNSLRISLGVEEEYNDNLFYTESNETSDRITVISPKIELASATERLNASLSAAMKRIMYRDHDELDQTDQTYGAEVSFHVNDKLHISSRVDYLRDSRRERDLETTGLVQDDTTRNRGQYGISGNYLLSEKDAIGFTAAYEKDDFEKSESADFEALSGSLTYARSIDPATRMRLRFGYSDADYELTEIDNYSMAIGVNRKVNESLSLDAELGGRWTRTEQALTLVMIDPITFTPYIRKMTEEKDSSGFIGSLALDYKGDRYAFGLLANHDVRNASGRSGTTKRTAFVASASKQLTEAWSFYITGGYYLNEADDGDLAAEDIEERTIQVRPKFRYRFNHDLSLDLAYRFAEVEDEVDHTTARNSSLLLNVLYRNDLLE